MEQLVSSISARNFDGLKKLLSETRSAILNLPATSKSECIITQARSLWNASVLAGQAEYHVHLVTLTSCRELAFLALQSHLKAPFDDQMLLEFLEMSVRLARAFNTIADIGKHRLYLSKAIDFQEYISRDVILSPHLDEKYQNVLCLFYCEKLKNCIGNENESADLVLSEAFTKIKIQYLPYMISDIVNNFSAMDHPSLLGILESLYNGIRPLTSFPAHICDDLIYLLVDKCLADGQKPKLEKAGGLLELISIPSEMFYKSKLKFLVTIGADNQQALKCLQAAVGKGASVYGLIELLEKSGNSQDILRDLKASIENVALDSLEKMQQSELAEVTLTGLLGGDFDRFKGQLDKYLLYLDDNSCRRLQKLVFEHAQAMYTQKDIRSCLLYLRVLGSLLKNDDPLDQANSNSIQRLKIYCLIDLGEYDEVEEMLMDIPMDVEGLSLRMMLSIGLKNLNDSLHLLDSLTQRPQVTLDTLLCLANRCHRVKEFELLLHILSRIISKFDTEKADLSLKLSVIKSAACIAIQTIAEGNFEERIDFMLSFIDASLALLLAGSEVEDAESLFKIGWNAGIEALKYKSYEKAAIIFGKSHRMLCCGQWKASESLSKCKILCIMNCISALCMSPKGSMLLGDLACEATKMIREARGMLEEVERSATYLPAGRGKRQKFMDAQVFTVDLPFDLLKVRQAADLLQFQAAILSLDEEGALNALQCLNGSGSSYESMEGIVGWFAEYRDQMSTKVMIAFLQSLSEKLIASADRHDVDLAKFSLLYRAMIIIARGEEGQEAAALEYYRQGLAIIKAFPDYPKEEVCWLAVSSYNMALSIARMNADRGRAWCELSLAILHHSGQYRDSYEHTIRAGYSKLLKRLFMHLALADQLGQPDSRDLTVGAFLASLKQADKVLQYCGDAINDADKIGDLRFHLSGYGLSDSTTI